MYKQVLIEIPYVLVQATAYVLVVYSMLGFAWTPAKFFWFYYITVISLLMFTYYGMMMVAITPNVILASIVSAFFSTLFNLYAGFLIPRPVRTKTLIHHTFSTLSILHPFFGVFSFYYTTYGKYCAHLNSVTCPLHCDRQETPSHIKVSAQR